MFAFKLWSNFGVFRDPITITQNITLPIPPKTMIGGFIAAILGIDYNDYLNQPDYFDFKYSIVLNHSIRKKSFCQNYLEDYTKKSEIKFNAIDNFFKKELNILNDINEKSKINDILSDEFKKLDKKITKFFDDIQGKMTKPKPIYRELLINPSYLVFIDNFKDEEKIINTMKEHSSSFALYMGNSEFPANYEFLDCKKITQNQLNSIHSFTVNTDKINFEEGKKYTRIHCANKAVGKREYRDYKKIVICDQPICFNEKINGYSIQLPIGDFNCEFI